MKLHTLTRYLKVFILIVCMTSFSFPQTTNAPATRGDSTQTDLTVERASLISGLQFLNRETLRFNDPLAVALAKAEIADAAWQLDKAWAKKLLRAAYELALPKADQNQDRPAGSMPPMPDATARSRQKIRNRILDIARRDAGFANELVQMEAERLGVYGRHMAEAMLASQSIEDGNIKASADYILQAIKADPTLGTAPHVINEVALQDRALADTLILRYIEELRTFPVNSRDQSDIRTFITLSNLVRPSIFDPDVSREPIKVPPPGPVVMRAYVGYMLEFFNRLEQREPGYKREG